MPPNVALNQDLHCCQSSCLLLSRMKRVKHAWATIEGGKRHHVSSNPSFTSIVCGCKPQRLRQDYHWFR